MSKNCKELRIMCLDVVYKNGKDIINNIPKSDEEQRFLNKLSSVINLFKFWNLSNVIEPYEKDEVNWKIVIKDIHNTESITITLRLQSTAEYKRFKAFIRHLNFNWFQNIKAQKLDDDFLSFLIIHPAPVLLHIFPSYHKYLKEHSSFDFTKSTSVKTVFEIVNHHVKEFTLYLLKEPKSVLENTKNRKTREEVKIPSLDDNPIFRRNDIFYVDSYYYKNTTPSVLLQELKQAYASATNTSGSVHLHKQQHVRNSSSFKSEQSLEVERLRVENAKMKKSIEALVHEVAEQNSDLQSQIDVLRDKNEKMAAAMTASEIERQETLAEFGRLNVELTRIQNEKKRIERFDQTYKSQSTSTQTSEISRWGNTMLGSHLTTNHSTSAEVSGAQAHVEDRHGQETIHETLCLTDIPHTGVDGAIYNNYKLLLFRISDGLLKEEVLKLKQWIETEFHIDTSGSINSILLELDRKRIISIKDLSRLKKFFEDNLRYDFVHLIDTFLLGDYGPLKNSSRPGIARSLNRGLNAQIGLTTQRFSNEPSSSQWLQRSTGDRSTETPQDPAAVQQRNTATDFHATLQRILRLMAAQTEDDESRSRQVNQRYGPNSNDSPPTGTSSSTSYSYSKEAERNKGSGMSQSIAVVTDGGARVENEVQTSSSTLLSARVNNSRNTDQGSNGQKLSKFQRSDSSSSSRPQGRANPPDDDDSQWLCSHYKRRCLVQFECCSKFWPCHRCHNNQSSCGRRKLKSRDTKRIKCVACGQEQAFAEFCSRCNARFARYYCGLCKHLTGTDDNPYHCEKCGICRIHGDRSFHCDVCGVCLDVQLLGNHKCREGSAHDECCICLEDAFTGCQILPCSHKVHKECATQMIRSGITRCPICRESFAHKLERRNTKSLKKPPGKE